MYPHRVDAPAALVEALADRYRVDRQLGAGGMATVYLAHDHKHDREVAIKVLRPDLAETLGRERFLREIQLAARLNHPNILPLYDSGDANGCMYFVMPVMEGQTLRDRLSSGSPLPVDEAVRIAVEVADALDYAHRRDIVHRDIKPENILLHEGHAVVADFGIGKALVAASAATGVMFTQIGVTVGTPAYMSPEQAAGGDLDGRSDLFALGCVMFEMLTGEIAFTGPSAHAVIARRFAYSPPPITDSRPEIPAAVGETVSRLLQRSADDRFATGSQVVAALRPRPTPPVATAAVAPDRARRDSSIVRVTSTTAATFWPALSSDARLVVYVSDAGQDGATPQVWLQQVGGAAVQLTTGMRDCAEPVFSPDDTRVIFSAGTGSTRHVYEMPTFGGQPRVLKRMARGARFAPDGTWLVYLAIDSHDAVRIVSATGDERVVTTGLVDVAFATWSDDCRHLLVVGHPNPSADLDCWIVPVDGGAPVDTGVLRRARQQGSIVISMAVAWTGDSLFYTAAGRQGIHVWRQHVSPTTFEAIGSPELMTPGGDSAFFPTVARQRLAFVGVHADTNMWSVGIDARTGKAKDSPRRLTRGAGFVNHFTVSRDGNTLAYFAAGPSGADLHVRDLQRSTDATLGGDAGDNRGFPVISLDGKRLAFGTLVAGPPVRRPLFVANVADGACRLIHEDCGGRPRLWLDDDLLLAETFGSGLNSFVVLDTREGTQHPLLLSRDRRLSNPRLSTDARWLAFDATPPGGSPSVLVARLADSHAADETAWILIDTSASHPFWSRDGRLLYYLPTTPTVDIRNRVVARPFDPLDGSVGAEPIDVLLLSEMIVPAMISSAAPIMAADQIFFLLGNYRGDIWMMNLQA